MLWVPQKGKVRVVTNAGIVGTATPGTGVPGSATSLAYGTITELIAAAANDQDSWGIDIWISATGLSATAAEATVDILAGAAPEVTLIKSLICGYAVASGAGHHYFFPLHIPAGTRIAAQLASVRTSITAQVVATLYGGCPPPFKVGRKVTTYGTKVNNARGQAVTPAASGATASVTQMTAASSEDHFAFLPGFQPATDTTITPTGYVNVGIGIGASPEQRIGTWWFKKDTNEDCGGPFPSWPVFQDVPAGTRLSLLASNSGANDAAYDGHIYAVS